MKIFQIALGILAAIGGFVDIGDLVFNVAAGATFGYQLLWVVVVGVVRDHRLLGDVRPRRRGLRASRSSTPSASALGFGAGLVDARCGPRS